MTDFHSRVWVNVPKVKPKKPQSVRNQRYRETHREKYNLFMKEYMREYRKGKRRNAT